VGRRGRYESVVKKTSRRGGRFSGSRPGNLRRPSWIPANSAFVPGLRVTVASGKATAEETLASIEIGTFGTLSQYRGHLMPEKEIRRGCERGVMVLLQFLCHFFLRTFRSKIDKTLDGGSR
jgi:hypothetical protein